MTRREHAAAPGESSKASAKGISLSAVQHRPDRGSTADLAGLSAKIDDYQRAVGMSL